MEFTVFYAWQSDRSTGINKHFIRDALELATKRIAKDASVLDSPRLDQDTKGVAGLPEIAKTIFDKIDACGAFVADVSFVGRGEGEEADGRLLPNPNVMIELGYALARVGASRVLLVMNTTFGEADGLPFDIRHRRWPLDYCLASSDDRAVVKSTREKLAKELEAAIRAIVASEPLGRVDPALRREVLTALHDPGPVVPLHRHLSSERILIVDRSPRGVFAIIHGVGTEAVAVSGREQAALKELVTTYRAFAEADARLTSAMVELAGSHLQPRLTYRAFWELVAGYCLDRAGGLDHAAAYRLTRISQNINHDGKDCERVWPLIEHDPVFTRLWEAARVPAGECLGALQVARDLLPAPEV